MFPAIENAIPGDDGDDEMIHLSVFLLAIAMNCFPDEKIE